MTRGKSLTRSALVLVIALLVPWVGAQERAPESSLTSLTVDLPKDERVYEGLGFREISGRFELARPVESVALTVEAFHDGVKSAGFPRGWVQPGDERRGNFAVLFVDLETPANADGFPAAARAFYKGWLSMGKAHGIRGWSDVDTERLIDLKAPVEYHVFEPNAATDASAPLFVMYAGTAPLDSKDVRSVEEMLKRNPKGRLVVASLRFNDHPRFKLPVGAK